VLAQRLLAKEDSGGSPLLVKIDEKNLTIRVPRQGMAGGQSKKIP